MLFIVNPVSALGSTPYTWKAAKRLLKGQGVVFDERITTGPGSATAIALEAFRSGVDRVIAVGGDGTLNEVVNGYFGADGCPVNPDAAIGLIPSGTGSDFRKTLGINDLDYAISTLRADAIQSIDVALVELQLQSGSRGKRYLVNISSVGLGGDAVRLVNGWRHTWPGLVPGKVRFVAAALVALIRFEERHTEVIIDGSKRKLGTGLIVAANGRYAGAGMMFAPSAELNDGLLDIILTENINRLDVIREIPRIMKGTYLRNPKVRLLQGRELSVTSDRPFAVDIDGEFVGYTPFQMRVIPQALRFIVPAGLKAVMSSS